MSSFVVYGVIVAGVLILTPLTLNLASKQDKQIKSGLRRVFVLLLFLVLVTGLFNWETFSGPGRSGYPLAIAYPSSLVGLVFIITVFQLFLVVLGKRASNLLAVIFNFVNSVVIMAALIRVSNMAGRQLVSWVSITAVFAVLVNNVVGLLWLNRDPQLMSKWPWSQAAVKVARKKLKSGQPAVVWWQQLISWSLVVAGVGFLFWLFLR